MSLLIILFVVFTILAILINKLTNKKSNNTNYPYRKLDALFTPAERSFFGVLLQTVGNDAHVFGKVRVADILGTKKGMDASSRRKAFNKISSKHFDFILCSKKDLSILCAIELNDKSHNSKKRQDRDKFLEGACEAASTPLIQIKAKASYNPKDIRRDIEKYLPIPQSTMAIDSFTKDKSVNPKQSDNKKICQKCSSVMVKKTAKKGKNIGGKFWACISYPKCKNTEAINNT